MKRILLRAYLNKNLGDDLFIYIIGKKYQDCCFYTIADRSKTRAFHELKNIKTIPRSFVVRVVEKILKKNILLYLISRFCHATWYIGGSLFIESGNWEERLDLLEKYIDYSQKFFVSGINFGPYYSKKYFERSFGLLERAEDVCFRDLESHTLFSNLKNVRVASDIAFNLEMKDIAAKKIVAISLIELEGREGLECFRNPYVDKIKEIINYFLKQDYLVRLFAFCQNEGDEKICRYIKDSVKSESVEVIVYESKIEQFLEQFLECEIIIATRFHSMVLGWMYERNVIPVIYSIKMTNVIRDFNYQGYWIDIKKMEQLAIEKIRLNANAGIDIKNEKLNAKKQFAYLEELL